MKNPEACYSDPRINICGGSRLILRKTCYTLSCYKTRSGERIDSLLHNSEMLTALSTCQRQSCVLIKSQWLLIVFKWKCIFRILAMIKLDPVHLPTASKVDVSKHGMMKFREDKNLLGLNTGSFHDRYFILTPTSLRLYKEVRVRG